MEMNFCHSSSSSSAPSSSSSPAESSRVESLNEEIAELRARLSSAPESDNLFTQPSVKSDEDEICPPHSNLQAYELRQISSEEQLHQTMLPHFLFTISPIVLETFEILEGVDPRDPSAVLSNLLSFCQSEDPVVTY
ncbi:hypothetical protein P9112_009944 [Eukaryota sp. TZLM1-RC]